MVNEEKKLCGKLTINLSKKVTEEKYLYLYNREKEKYQKLETGDITNLSIDTAGKYLLTSKKQSGFTFNVMFIGIGSIAILISAGVYIGVKKRYWFW